MVFKESGDSAFPTKNQTVCPDCGAELEGGVCPGCGSGDKEETGEESLDDFEGKPEEESEEGGSGF